MRVRVRVRARERTMIKAIIGECEINLHEGPGGWIIGLLLVKAGMRCGWRRWDVVAFSSSSFVGF